MKLIKPVAIATFAVALAGCNEQAADKAASNAEVELTTQQQKMSYLIGQNMAKQFQAQGFHLDSDALLLAVRDVAEGKERLSQEEIAQTIETFQKDQLALQQEAQAKAEAEFNQLAEKNLAEGQVFLQANGAKEDVVTTDTGLQYKVLASGEGATPGAADSVEVHYRGTLIDGSEFDSSFKRGVPANFQVNQVIPGWTEALQLMKEGDKWQLTIPAELAYGPGGTPSIGPNSVLQFDVELLKVTPAQTDDKG
ncbi:FKBP-type peptidyl-prolyl cis-trans isomerase [bacterium SCSIO 12696]|nr:FKBP-type peptidyl-prolyl cis-trans isomerase [bacterium SCSIO 12696]